LKTKANETLKEIILKTFKSWVSLARLLRQMEGGVAVNWET
jgi:hypothetical protein